MNYEEAFAELVSAVEDEETTEKTREFRAVIQGIPSLVPCPSCGEKTIGGSEFCNRCGASMTKRTEQKPQNETAVCTGCGTVLAKGMRFCTKCGKPVSGAQTQTSTPSAGPKKCLKCGTVFANPKMAFCTKCGIKLV